MSFPQEKDREKEKVGDRPARLNEKKGDRELERETKTKEDIFCWKKNKNLVAATNVKKSGSEKKQ